METRRTGQVQTNDTIQLDIDGKIDFAHISRIINILKTEYKLLHGEVYDTENGHHIYIKCDRALDGFELVALQLVLGSDANREAYNIQRIANGEWQYWNLLYQKKEVFNSELTKELCKLIL